MRRYSTSAAVLLVALATCGAATAASRRSLDLGTARVDGHVVLGRTLADVTASLGRPTWRVPGTRVYRIGYGDRKNFELMVMLRKQGGVLRAWSIAFERPPLVEPLLAEDVLALSPSAFARDVMRQYGAFTVTAAPKCRRGRCAVTLRAGHSPRYVTFGRTPALGSYLTMWII
jgi:hypothetical protein